MDKYDVIIIGAGPAGSASALFLHKRGYRTLILEQAQFPRDRVCGEFISPAADPILAELGVLESIEALSPCRLGGVAVSAYEKKELCIDYPPLPGNGRRMTSLSLKRKVLDPLMLERVRECGIEVREKHKVTDFQIRDGAVVGVKVLDPGKKPFSLSARVVLDAGGRNGISLRRFNLKRRGKGAGKIALAAHWQGKNIPRDYCYMHISQPGYTGMAAVGEEEANVVLVVDEKDLKGRDIHEFYLGAVLKNRRRREILSGAHAVERVRTVDSLAYSVKRVPCGGLVLVGDAMGFIDPFTGEGIYLSLRSAQLAAESIGEGFKAGGFSRNYLQSYETRRHREFHKKFALSRVLQRLIYNPSLCNFVVGALGKNPSLASTLVGVLGDYIPAEKVVSLKFLIKLFSGTLNPENNSSSALVSLRSTFRE